MSCVASESGLSQWKIKLNKIGILRIGELIVINEFWYKSSKCAESRHLFPCIAVRGNRLWKSSYYTSTDAPLTHTHTRRQVSWGVRRAKGILEHSSNFKNACCVFIHSVKPVKISENTSTTDCLHSTYSLILFWVTGFCGAAEKPASCPEWHREWSQNGG